MQGRAMLGEGGRSPMPRGIGEHLSTTSLAPAPRGLLRPFAHKGHHAAVASRAQCQRFAIEGLDIVGIYF